MVSRPGFKVLKLPNMNVGRIRHKISFGQKEVHLKVYSVCLVYKITFFSSQN